MTESEVKSILQKKYDYTNWKEFLSALFFNVQYLSQPHILAENTDTAKHVRQIGFLPFPAESKNIGIFDVHVASNVIISRNRVRLREIAAKYIDMDKINGAFVFYYHPKQNDYRFTFIIKKSFLTEEGEHVKYQTPAKRYTYVLGPNESCTTAAKRLLELQKFPSITLDNIEQAFSVEKLNKEFFKRYKDYYEKFCNELSTSSYRKSVFNIPYQ